jgi:hypothetical protein
MRCGEAFRQFGVIPVWPNDALHSLRFSLAHTVPGSAAAFIIDANRAGALWWCVSNMRRTVTILVVCVLCGAGFLAWRAGSSRHSQSSESLGQALKTAATNPVEFAKNRLTGGIGVVAGTNLGSSFPVIRAVAANSPADRAGLFVGDLIIRVDGLSTSNRPLRQVADEIRGLSGGRLTLTIRRGGIADFECVVKRTSRNTLLGLSHKDE